MTWIKGKCPSCNEQVYVLEEKEAYCPFCDTHMDIEAIKKNPWIKGKCPSCHKDVYALEEKKIPCPHCGTSIHAKTIIRKDQWTRGRCPSCGEQVYALENRKTHCPYCAASIDANALSDKNPWIKGKCRSCHNEVYALEEKTIPCPYCGTPIDARSIKKERRKKPSNQKRVISEPNRASSGKAIGFGLLCYVLMATLMMFTSIAVFQSLGYSAYIGPNLIALVISIIMGFRYKSTGNAFGVIILSLIIGVALGLALPHLGIYFSEMRYGK